MNNTKIQNCYTFQIKTTYSECVLQLVLHLTQQQENCAVCAGH